MFFDQQQHNSMNTPTPRTDAEWSASFDEYSQQLETELTALTAERDQLRAEFEKIAVTSAQLADNNVSLRQERDQLRAELATERARLDFLSKRDGAFDHIRWGDYRHYWGRGFGSIREIIDAAMKKGAK